MRLRRVRLLPTVCGAMLALACGGKSGKNPDETDVGPVHDGNGLYELRIESLSDDCTPPLWSGNAGEVVVVVATGQGAEGPRVGANIPVYSTPPDPAFMATRWDVDLQDPAAFEVPPSLLPGCPGEIKQRYEVTPLLADSAHIDIEFVQRTLGPASCSDVAQYCTSRRIFHFRWLRACASNTGDLTCG